MNAEYRFSHQPTKKNMDTALLEIKDQGILLEIASEYLCEKVFLEKVGQRLEKNLERVKKGLAEMKEKFFKPAENPEMEAQIQVLSGLVSRLKDPEKELKYACVEGELGKQIVHASVTLGSAIHQLRGKLRGGTASYTPIDAMIKFLRRFTVVGQAMADTTRIAFRVCVYISLICFGLFLVLFLTLESEKELRKNVDYYTRQVNALQQKIPPIDADYDAIRARIADLKKEEFTKTREMQIMELNMDGYKLLERKERIEVEMKILQDRLDEKTEKLYEINSKNLLERLLRL